MADEVQRSKKQWGEKSAGGRRTDESLTHGSWTVRLTSAGDGCERRVRVCGVVSLGVGGVGLGGWKLRHSRGGTLQESRD